MATTKPAVAAAGAAGPITKTGPVVNTRYGPVQVKITMTNGKITASDAIQSPNDRSKSVAINARAVPVLNAEALKTQSAQIDTVGGATITSHGYQQSLQAAIDAARAG